MTPGPTAVLSLLGPPGSGKSTQARMLCERVPGAVRASVPLLRDGEPGLVAHLSADQRSTLRAERPAADAARDAGRLAPMLYDDLLFAAVARIRAPLVVLDGAPRGPAQVASYVARPDLLAATVFVELCFGTDPRARSTDRQRHRARSRDQPVDGAASHRFETKFATFAEVTSVGIAALSTYVAVHRISADDPPALIHQRILHHVG